MTVADQSCK